MYTTLKKQFKVQNFGILAFIDQKCTYEKVQQKLGRALTPPHLDKIQELFFGTPSLSLDLENYNGKWYFFALILDFFLPEAIFLHECRSWRSWQNPRLTATIFGSFIPANSQNGSVVHSGQLCSRRIFFIFLHISYMYCALEWTFLSIKKPSWSALHLR